MSEIGSIVVEARDETKIKHGMSLNNIKIINASLKLNKSFFVIIGLKIKKLRKIPISHSKYKPFLFLFIIIFLLVDQKRPLIDICRKTVFCSLYFSASFELCLTSKLI